VSRWLHPSIHSSNGWARGGGGGPMLPRATRVTFAHQSHMASGGDLSENFRKTSADNHSFLEKCSRADILVGA